jgi:uncharacterized membrane protein
MSTGTFGPFGYYKIYVGLFQDMGEKMTMSFVVGCVVVILAVWKLEKKFEERQEKWKFVRSIVGRTILGISDGFHTRNIFLKKAIVCVEVSLSRLVVGGSGNGVFRVERLATTNCTYY